MKKFRQRYFLYNSCRMIVAYKIYKKVLREVGRKTTILLSPHLSTGDAYIIGSLLKKYASLHCKDNNYIYLCSGQTCAKIISGMFNIERILVIPMRERDMLEDLYRFLGDDRCNIRVMHYQGVCIYTGILANMRAYKNIDFMSMLRYCAFQLPDSVIPDEPKFLSNKKYVDALFKKNHIIEGKTVILAPIAGSMPNLPYGFWETLSVVLLNRGYKVVTNIAGQPEYPVERTSGLQFPLSCAKQVVERAGYFIGYRSGFCDIISSAKCKKVIIYQPEIKFGVGTVKDYFGLENMGLAKDVLEVNYNKAFEGEIIDSITGYFENI